MRRERGAAFLIALGALALIAALAAAALSLTAGPATRAAAAVEQARATRIAEAMIHRIASGLALEEVRALAPLDGTVVSTEFLGAKADFALQDAAGLVDLNAAPQPLLTRLLTLTGAPAREAEEIARLWARARAERGGRSAFASVEDALTALPDRLRPAARGAEAHLGTWSALGAVDPWAATAPAFAAAADLPLETAQGFVARRALEGRAAPLPPGADLDGFAASDGLAIRIAARTETEGGGRAALTAVIRVSASPQRPVEFLSWR